MLRLHEDKAILTAKKINKPYKTKAPQNNNYNVKIYHSTIT